MNSRTKCAICKKQGKKLFEIPYSSKKMSLFLQNYYGKNKKIKKFITQLKDYHYVLLKCEMCQFIWQQYSLKEKLQKVLYDEIIDYKSSYKKSKKMFKLQKNSFQNEFNFIKNFFKSEKVNVLDYGAGWGSWILSIKNKRNNTYALEFSKRRQKILSKEGIRLISLPKLIEKKNKIDFIRVEQVLEHLDNLNEALNIFHNVSKKNSLLQIAVPNSKALFKNGWNKRLLTKGPAQPLEHLNSFTKKSLNKLLYKFSFKKISIIDLFRLFLLDFKNFKIFIKIIYNNLNNTSVIVRKF